MTTLSEQIQSAEATRQAKQNDMSAIMQKALDESRTTDEAEAQHFDTLGAEVKTIDADLVRLRTLERMAAANAAPVQASAQASRPVSTGVSSLQFKPVPKALPPGIRFARYVRCLGLGYAYHRDPVSICERMYPEDAYMRGILERAAVPAATTTDADWLGALVPEESGMFAEFLEFLRPQTILGKFGNNGIPALHDVPFRTSLATQTSGGSAYWVGEGKAKPLTQWGAGKTSLLPLKVATIAVATMELLRDSRPSADSHIRSELARAVGERLDIDFIDPGKTEVSGISPASITNGATAIPSSGSDADAVRADIQALFDTFIAAENPPTSGVWVMGPSTALALSMMQNPLGQSEFPNFGMRGGNLFELPSIISSYAVRDTEGAIVALVNADQIWYADEGAVDVRVSNEASLEMDTVPTNASDVPTETTMVSMFQTNSVAFLAERTVNWTRARDSAVAYLTGVTWGAAS